MPSQRQIRGNSSARRANLPPRTTHPPSCSRTQSERLTYSLSSTSCTSRGTLSSTTARTTSSSVRSSCFRHHRSENLSIWTLQTQLSCSNRTKGQQLLQRHRQPQGSRLTSRHSNRKTPPIAKPQHRQKLITSSKRMMSTRKHLP